MPPSDQDVRSRAARPDQSAVADGTIVFTTPTGHTYSTQPLGGMLFRALKQSSGELPIRVLDESAINRALMMLRRKQTRQ